jgi:hypothetical protein
MIGQSEFRLVAESAYTLAEGLYISLNNPQIKSKGLITTLTGPITLVSFSGCVLLITCWALSLRWWKQIKRLHPAHSGALRYSGAQGNIAALDLISTQRNFTADDEHDGFTALHAAAVCGNKQAVQWILDHGSNVGAVKNDG